MSYLILGAILVGLVILAVPISLGYDSEEKYFKVKWLGLTLIKRVREKPKKPKKPVTRKNKLRSWEVLWRLWEKRELDLELIHRVWRFISEVFRTLNFRDSEAGISLPDPMWNGLLFAVVSNIQLKDMDASVNFENRNFAKIRVTVYPYRVAPILTGLLLHLPYIRMIRFAWDLKKLRQDRKNES